MEGMDDAEWTKILWKQRKVWTFAKDKWRVGHKSYGQPYKIHRSGISGNRIK